MKVLANASGSPIGCVLQFDDNEFEVVIYSPEGEVHKFVNSTAAFEFFDNIFAEYHVNTT